MDTYKCQTHLGAKEEPDSLGYFEKQGYAFSRQPNSGCLKITKGVLVVMRDRRLSNNLYSIEGSVATYATEVFAAAQEEQLAYRLWHYRMDHISDRGFTELSKKSLILVLKKEKINLYEPYIYGKQHRVRFANSFKHGAEVLELVHSDVWGPTPVSTKNGARYF